MHCMLLQCFFLNSEEKLGYGLGGSQGIKQLPEHMVDRVRNLFFFILLCCDWEKSPIYWFCFQTGFPPRGTGTSCLSCAATCGECCCKAERSSQIGKIDTDCVDHFPIIYQHFLGRLHYFVLVITF